jgi:membrane protease YdiL (CAAX protease family)
MGQTRLQQVRNWLLGPRRQRVVPWSGLELVAAILASEVLIPGLVVALLTSSRLFDLLYGADFVALATQPGNPETHAVPRIRLSIWVSIVALPLQVLAILVVLRRGSDTLPYQLGLTSHRLWRNLVLGLLAGVVLAAVVNGLNLLVIWGYQQIYPVETDQHPYFQLKGHLAGIEWIVLLLSVIVAAPLREELTLRGLLQPWLAQRPWGGSLAAALALMFALLKREDQFRAGLGHANPGEVLQALQPALFVVLAALGLFLLQRWTYSPSVSAIYGTALFFAALHSSVWPTPVSLFVLGLGLGWLAWRTQSLVAPITVHALFNAVGCLEFLPR